MSQLLKRWIANAVRRVGVAFVVGFALGGVFVMYLWRRIGGRSETREILNDPKLTECIKASVEDIRAGRVKEFGDEEND